MAKEKLVLSHKAMQYEYLSNQQAEEGYQRYLEVCKPLPEGNHACGLTFAQWLDIMEYRIY